MQNIEQYRAANPEATQGMSDYELTARLYEKFGKGKEFGAYSQEFLGTAARTAVDRSPKPQPVTPSTGAEPGFMDTANAWGQRAFGSLELGGASIFEGLNNIVDLSTKAEDAVFGQHLIKGGGFERAAKYLAENGTALHEASKKQGMGFVTTTLADALGGAVPGIAEFATGPWVAGLRGLADADKAGKHGAEWLAAGFYHALKRYALGKAFGWIKGSPLPLSAKAVSAGSVMAAETALEGGDRRTIAKAFATGALFEVAMPGKKAEGKTAAERKAYAEKIIAEKGVKTEDPAATPPTPAEAAVSGDSLGEILPGSGDRRTGPRDVATDRRSPEQRAKSADLSHEELVKLRLHDDLTGAPNMVAHREAAPRAVTAFTDMEGLKYVNHVYGDPGGDALLKAKADAYRQAGVEFYRKGGDEFVLQFDSPAEAEVKLAEANKILAATQIKMTRLSDGQKVIVSGARFTHGLGTDIATSNKAMELKKVEEQAAGVRNGRDKLPIRWKEEQDTTPETPVSTNVEKPTPAENDKENLNGRLTKEQLYEDQGLQQRAKDITIELKKTGSDAYSNPDAEINLTKYVPEGLAPDRVKRLQDLIIDNLRHENAKAGAGPRSLEDVSRAADRELRSLGLEDEKAYLTKVFGSLDKVEEHVRAARIILKANMMKADELYGKAASAGATEFDKVRFLQQLAYIEEIEPMVKGSISRVARATTSGRLEIGGKEYLLKNLDTAQLDASLELKTGVEAIFKNLGGDTVFKRLAADWTKKTDLRAKMKVIRKMRGSKLMNALLEFRATNMLTSVNTQIVNMTSNISHLLVDTFDNYTAAAIGPKTGVDRVTFHEANARAYGVLTGFWDGFKAIPGALKEGYKTTRAEGLKGVEAKMETTGPDPYMRAQQEGLTPNAISRAYLEDSAFGRGLRAISGGGTINNLLWKMVDTYGSVARGMSFGFMNLSDGFIKKIAYNTEVKALLIRKGYELGKTRAEIDSYANANSKIIDAYREGKQLKFSGTEAEVKAKEAFVQDINNKGLLKSRVISWQENMSEGAQRRIEQALKETPALRLLIPFYKTPMNLLKFIPRRTPGLHRLSETMMADINAGGARRAQAHARLVSGTLMWTAAAALYAAGVTTGKHEDNEKATMMGAGIQEYSIYDPWRKKFVQYNRTDPFGQYLGIMSDVMGLARRASDPDFHQTYSQLILIGANNVLNKTWATTLSDMFLLYKEPERYGESFFKKYAATFLPMSGLARSVNDYADPHLRESRSFVDSVLNVYWSRGQAERLDDYGKSTEKAGRFFGVNQTKPRFDSPVRMEMAHLHIPSQMPKDQTLGADMTDAQFYEFRKMMDTDLHMEDRMNAVVQSAGYQKASYPVRKQILEELRHTFHGAARMKLMGKDPAVKATYKTQLMKQLGLYSRHIDSKQGTVSDWGKFLSEGRVENPLR